MIFSEVMQEVASRIDGCLGLVVMGMDGIPIEKLVLDPSANFEMLSTECTAILHNSRQAAEEVGAGALKEMIWMTDKLIVVAVAITDDYVFLCAMRQGGNYGKARFLVKRASLRLEKEFA